VRFVGYVPSGQLGGIGGLALTGLIGSADNNVSTFLPWVACGAL
jgi:hypothetical protein